MLTVLWSYVWRQPCWFSLYIRAWRRTASSKIVRSLNFPPNLLIVDVRGLGSHTADIQDAKGVFRYPYIPESFPIFERNFQTHTKKKKIFFHCSSWVQLTFLNLLYKIKYQLSGLGAMGGHSPLVTPTVLMVKKINKIAQIMASFKAFSLMSANLPIRDTIVYIGLITVYICKRYPKHLQEFHNVQMHFSFWLMQLNSGDQDWAVSTGPKLSEQN